MSKKPEILPCPYCGADAELVKRGEGWHIVCTRKWLWKDEGDPPRLFPDKPTCFLQLSGYGRKDKDALVGLWNNREGASE